MTEAQKRSLTLLERITPHATTKRNRRSSELLCSVAVKPPYDKRPEEWEEGWCEGWAFCVHPSMAAALDIQLVPRVMRGKRTLEWTQGSGFDFHEGYTIHDVKEAYLRMGEALQHINISIRIIKATPAEPASPAEAAKPATLTKPAQPARPAMPREPGSVTYQVYKPNAERTALLPYGTPQTVTHDAFVRILITGLLGECGRHE